MLVFLSYSMVFRSINDSMYRKGEESLVKIPLRNISLPIDLKAMLLLCNIMTTEIIYIKIKYDQLLIIGCHD